MKIIKTLRNLFAAKEPELNNDELSVMDNIKSLRNDTAQDIMIPRSEIIAIAENTDLSKIAQVFIVNKVNNILVYKSKLDDVIGVLNVRDFLQLYISNEPLSSLLKSPLFISPAIRLFDLLTEMRQKDQKVVLVVDEHGGVDGLVTLTSLVEEIVGNLQNVDLGEKDWIEQRDSSIIFNAKVTLEEIEEKFGMDLHLIEKDVDSLGGVVFALLGRIPMVGEKLYHPNGYELEVLDTDQRRVKKVAVKKL